MKKLIGSSFLWLHGQDRSAAVNTEEVTVLGRAGRLRLWRMTMALLLGTMLLGFSATAVGQAVNATLLGTVTDSSGGAVANVKVTTTETNTGISHTS